MKKCEFGHYYPDHLPACPYCNPGILDEYGNAGETTEGFTGDETMVPEMENNFDMPTVELNDDPSPSPVPEGDTGFVVGPPPAAEPPADKTIIIDHSNDEAEEAPVTRPNRKLVGWLVSYTLDELGYDFRLYEGKNVIGKKPGLEVPVLQDPSVSNVHATILFRNNKFLLRDEFSTNGTYLNGRMVEQDTPELHDGDIIKVGNTVFKFKTAIF